MSILKSQEDFSNWAKSEAFRAAHKNAGSHSNIYLGHPVFEGFEIIMRNGFTLVWIFVCQTDTKNFNFYICNL